MGWRDVVEGTFEVTGRDGPALLAVNVIDELEYRIRANVGPAISDGMPAGSFLITRIVPLGEEWLISGVSGTFPSDQRDHVLRSSTTSATTS